MNKERWLLSFQFDSQASLPPRRAKSGGKCTLSRGRSQMWNILTACSVRGGARQPESWELRRGWVSGEEVWVWEFSIPTRC